MLWRCRDAVGVWGRARLRTCIISNPTPTLEKKQARIEIVIKADPARLSCLLEPGSPGCEGEMKDLWDSELKNCKALLQGASGILLGT